MNWAIATGIVVAWSVDVKMDLAVEDCCPFEQGLYQFLDNSFQTLGKRILEKKQLDDELRAEVRKAVEEFKAKFVAERSAAA